MYCMDSCALCLRKSIIFYSSRANDSSLVCDSVSVEKVWTRVTLWRQQRIINKLVSTPKTTVRVLKDADHISAIFSPLENSLKVTDVTRRELPVMVARCSRGHSCSINTASRDRRAFHPALIALHRIPKLLQIWTVKTITEPKETSRTSCSNIIITTERISE